MELLYQMDMECPTTPTMKILYFPLQASSHVKILTVENLQHFSNTVCKT